MPRKNDTIRIERCMHDQGMTLVEVLAALTILSTLMVTFLVSQSQSLAQQRAANHRRDAAATAEELLAEWRLEELPLTQPARGGFEEMTEWSWRRDVERVRVVGDVEMFRVTLTVERITHDHRSEVVLNVSWLEPLEPLEPGIN